MKYAIHLLLPLLLSGIAYGDKPPPLPTAIEALIPRHANVTWQATIQHNEGSDEWAVLYHVPLVGHNSSLSYLEFFRIDDDGTAIKKSRLYLGGRGTLAIDKISAEKDKIIIKAREHQHPDPISTPSKRVKLIIKHVNDIVEVSRIYPAAKP